MIDNYGSSDIICHENATNAKGHAAVAAGEKINIQWTTWPSSHHGPVISYLADCGDSCETVDKTTLEFFKIDGVGLVDDTDVPGTWGDDQLIANNNSWLVEIPPTLKAGYYVLRHEIIALHSAEEEDGAQNYPQCFNLQVTGSGTAHPSGVLEPISIARRMVAYMSTSTHPCQRTKFLDPPCSVALSLLHRPLLLLLHPAPLLLDQSVLVLRQRQAPAPPKARPPPPCQLWTQLLAR